MTGDRVLDVDVFTVPLRTGGPRYWIANINAGTPTTTRIVPPAGETHAFDRVTRPVNIEVCVSPTGRSVQVFINGKKVKP